MPEKVFRTAIYCRLSREDGDKQESNSIVSQRSICEFYIAKHDDLELVPQIFIDDGFSGVNFDRPSFRKLEKLLQTGEINCIVCKDLSRFARNYIDGGRYLEKIFPQLGVRFIAVNDSYDSLTSDPQSDSFVIPFKGLINDSYSKDISVKMRSSLAAKWKNGEFAGCYAPYGYQKAVEDRNQLIIDEDAGETVQMIFSLYKEGHEAIISREDFDAVKAILARDSQKRQENIQNNAGEHAKLIDLFAGKIVCADCGRRMYYHRKQMDKKGRPWYAFYECSTRVGRRHETCSRHYLRSDKLEVQVLAAIQIQTKTALDYEVLTEKLRDSPAERNIRDQQNTEILSLTLKRNSLSRKRARLYDDYTDGILDEEEYAFARKTFDSQFAELTKLLEEAVLRQNRFQEAISDTNRWTVLMKSISGAERLTQELVDNAIEQVCVREGGEIELVMRYSDIYADTVQSVKEIQRGFVFVTPFAAFPLS